MARSVTTDTAGHELLEDVIGTSALATLTTTDKTGLVEAINEVDANADAAATLAAMLTRETTVAGGKLELLEGTDNGSSKVTLAAPAALGGDRTITVPDADVVLADIATMAGAGVQAVGSGDAPAFVATNFSGVGAAGLDANTDQDVKSGSSPTLDGTNFTGVPQAGVVLADDLAALEALAGTGIAVHTAANTWAERSIAVDAGLSIADADGVAGNPTIRLDAPVLVATVLITKVQILALHTTPIELIAAEAGVYHEVVHHHEMLDFGSVAYDDAAADGNLLIKTAGGQTWATVEADGLIDGVADVHVHGRPATFVDVAPVAAAAVTIENDGAAFTDAGGTGDSVLRVRVLYHSHRLDLSV